MKSDKVRTTAILVGILMMPIHSYWISKIEAIVYKGGGGSTASLIWTSVYNLVILVMSSSLIKRWRPKLSLNQAELLAIFAMCNIAACVAGHDMVQILVPLITYPQWNATPENEWDKVLIPYLSDGVTVTDKLTLSHYFVGESSLYTVGHLRSWALPILCWSGFIFVLLVVALSLNVIVQRKWTEIDRLSYPVIQRGSHRFSGETAAKILMFNKKNIISLVLAAITTVFCYVNMFASLTDAFGLRAESQEYVIDGLVGFWTMDKEDIKGDTVKDVSGNGHDGKIQGDPKPIKGKLEEALHFDGKDDYIQLPDMGEEMKTSAEIWAYAEDVTKPYSGLVANHQWTAGCIHFKESLGTSR
ncbi:MAG: DUF6785 family protein [Planctomycetota bacterium]|jgi:hypothetical protein